MEKVNRLEDVFGAGSYVDCYVSTDAVEVAEALCNMGYFALSDGSDFLHGREDLFVYCEAVSNSSGLRVDCSDLTAEEADSIQKEIGFPVMGMARIYSSGTGRVENEFLSILKAMDIERQNIAFVSGNRFYSKTSEFYF